MIDFQFTHLRVVLNTFSYEVVNVNNFLLDLILEVIELQTGNPTKDVKDTFIIKYLSDKW